jgi:hypothetical protein
VFQAKVAEVEQESAYFLLFGRQLSRGGVTSEVWVEVRLPEGEAYPCADASQAAVVRGIVQQRLRDSGGSPLDGLRPALEQAKGAINKIYHCCSGANFRSGTPQACEANLEDVAAWLSGAGFLDYEGLAIDIADADYQGIDSDKSIVVHLDYRCPLRLQGVTRLDLTDELEAFVAELSAHGVSSSVKVRYYTQSTALDFFADYLHGASGASFQPPGAGYAEEVFILDFGGGSVEVYFAFEFGELGGDAGLGMRANAAGLSGAAKRALRFFFKRAATNPATVVVGVTAEYVVEATVEYWFNQGAHEGWLDALWAVGVRRGLRGLAVSLAENVINSHAATFVAEIAKYYIDTPYDQWNPAQALVQAGLGTVLGALLPEGVKAAFPKVGALADDIASKPGLIVDMLWDRRLVGAWEVAFRSQAVRTDLARLSKISQWLDNNLDRVKLTKTFDDAPDGIALYNNLNQAKSIYHQRVYIKDYLNIPGVQKANYTSNGLTVGKSNPSWNNPDLDLPLSEAKNFTDAAAKDLPEGTKIYRVTGGNPYGAYWTKQVPNDVGDVIGGTAVRPEWNSFEKFYVFTVPSGGLKVWEGGTARQRVADGVNGYILPGGAPQIFVPQVLRDQNFASSVNEIPLPW